MRERERNSATRWLYYFSIFGQLEQWKFAQNYEIFANVGWQFCQIHLIFFAKQFISIHINGTQKIQKTNHYILLTNVSIKRCIRTSFETDFIRGGRNSSKQTSTLQTESNPYPSHLVILDILSLWSVLYSARHWCKNYT